MKLVIFRQGFVGYARVSCLALLIIIVLLGGRLTHPHIPIKGQCLMHRELQRTYRRLSFIVSVYWKWIQKDKITRKPVGFFNPLWPFKLHSEKWLFFPKLVLSQWIFTCTVHFKCLNILESDSHSFSEWRYNNIFVSLKCHYYQLNYFHELEVQYSIMNLF